MRYRLKPVQIEARPLRYDNLDALKEWDGRVSYDFLDWELQNVYVYTSHGTLTAQIGDYIARLPDGELTVLTEAELDKIAYLCTIG